MGSLLQLLVLGLFIFVLNLRTVGYCLVALIIGATIQLAMTMVALRRNVPSIVPRYSRTSWSILLRGALPVFGVTISQAAAQRSDRILLAPFTSTRSIGVYSVAATAGEYLCVLAVALGQALFHPVASDGLSLERVRRVRRLIMTLTGLAAAVSIFAAPAIISATFGEPFIGAAWSMRVLLVAGIFFASYSIDVLTMLAQGRSREAGIIAVSGLVTVTVLDLVFIPILGIIGAAIGSTAGYMLMAGLARRAVVAPTRTRGGRAW
jgi:O-antigen/teichoic acid export membrane protein